MQFYYDLHVTKRKIIPWKTKELEVEEKPLNRIWRVTLTHKWKFGIESWLNESPSNQRCFHSQTQNEQQGQDLNQIRCAHVLTPCPLWSPEPTVSCVCGKLTAVYRREDIPPEEDAAQHPKHRQHSDAAGDLTGAGLSGRIHRHRLVLVSHFVAFCVIRAGHVWCMWPWTTHTWKFLTIANNT